MNPIGPFKKLPGASNLPIAGGSNWFQGHWLGEGEQPGVTTDFPYETQ